MSKELSVIDSIIAEQAEADVTVDILNLDDLSLAFVGGGGGMVDLG